MLLQLLRRSRRFVHPWPTYFLSCMSSKLFFQSITHAWGGLLNSSEDVHGYLNNSLPLRFYIFYGWMKTKGSFQYSLRGLRPLRFATWYPLQARRTDSWYQNAIMILYIESHPNYPLSKQLHHSISLSITLAATCHTLWVQKCSHQPFSPLPPNHDFPFENIQSFLSHLPSR